MRELAEIRSCNTSTLAYKLAQHRHIHHCSNQWGDIAANMLSICAVVAEISPQDSPVCAQMMPAFSSSISMPLVNTKQLLHLGPGGHVQLRSILPPLHHFRSSCLQPKLQTISSHPRTNYTRQLAYGEQVHHLCGTAYASWRCSNSAQTKITCSQNLCPSLPLSSNMCPTSTLYYHGNECHGSLPNTHVHIDSSVWLIM